jgi:hypothetical protein
MILNSKYSLLKGLLLTCGLTFGNAHASTYAACQASLKNLLLPAVPSKYSAKNVLTEIAQDEGRFYRVWLYVPGASVETQTMIATIDMDADKLTVRDVSKDVQHPINLKVDKAQFQAFADQCMGKPEKVPPIEVASTGLPMTSDVFFNCIGNFSGSGCALRYHELRPSAIPESIRKQFGQALDTFLLLPSAYGFQIYLAAKTQTDDTADYLYVFDGDRLVTTERVGWTEGNLLATYDISKEYLVSQYHREGDINSKINKVTHMKLRANGTFDECQKENPACK